MNKKFALCLPLFALLLTGCPHNQYIVELTPRGPAIERTLIFYREDGVGSNGVPNYSSFPADELSAITAAYHWNGIERDGDSWTATREFTTALPDDVGGAGSYASLSNTLGCAAFYMERFRGGDDFAGPMSRRQ